MDLSWGSAAGLGLFMSGLGVLFWGLGLFAAALSKSKTD